MTAKNYTQLTELHGKYAARGLVILGFPCNQFGWQEPGTNEEIKEFVRQYNVEFQLFDKINVNGKDAHPLWQWMKSKQSGTLGSGIKWNFSKFLVDTQGRCVARYGPYSAPLEIEDDIVRLLPEGSKPDVVL